MKFGGDRPYDPFSYESQRNHTEVKRKQPFENLSKGIFCFNHHPYRSTIYKGQLNLKDSILNNVNFYTQEVDYFIAWPRLVNLEKMNFVEINYLSIQASVLNLEMKEKKNKKFILSGWYIFFI